MFPVILPLFRTPFCSLHCQQFCIFLLMYFTAFSILFSGRVLNNLTSSSTFLPSAMFPHVISFSCSKERPKNHQKYQPSRALSVFSPSSNRVSALPSSFTSKGSMFPWPALWLVFGQLEAVHTTWQPLSPPGSCRLDHHLLRLVTAGLLSEFLMSQSAGPV